MSRMRLDQAMVERGLCASRARARDAIKRGYVSVNGQRASKASQMVDEGMRIEEQDPAAAYVSRAALKLLHGLEHFGFDPRDQVCVDIGASTGGFCQVLLERGARMVYGIDVGHDQMHPSLRGNPQLAVLEGINARQLDRSHVPDPFSFLVSDVSFISLRLALPPALLMAEPRFCGDPAGQNRNSRLARKVSAKAVLCAMQMRENGQPKQLPNGSMARKNKPLQAGRACRSSPPRFSAVTAMRNICSGPSRADISQPDQGLPDQIQILASIPRNRIQPTCVLERNRLRH